MRAAPDQAFGAGLAPGFVAVVSAEPTATNGLPGTPAWAEIPSVRVYGNWRTEELRRIRHPHGRLLVIGHCLATQRHIAETFRSALDAGDLQHLKELPGAYTCLVLRADEVIAITDIAGQFPVYYSRHRNETLIGLHSGLLAARHSRAPDPVTAAAFIACPNVLPLWSGRSPYQGVLGVGGGATLYVKYGHLRVTADSPAPDPGLTYRAAAGGLRAALLQSVLRRCETGPVSTDFSGGLDSTSLALLAARYRADPIRAVTYHNSLAPAGDLKHAIRCARLDSRIELTTVQGTAETLPYRSILVDPPASSGQELPGYDALSTSEPLPNVLAWRRSALRLAKVAEWETRIHLTGEGGDAVLGAAPSYLADLVRPRSVARLYRHCAAQARQRHASPLSLTWRAVRTATARPAAELGHLAEALRRPSTTTLTWPGAVTWWPVCGEAVGWLTTELRDRLAEIATDPLTARAIPPGLGAADVMAITELRRSAGAQRYLRQLGHRFGVAVHAPLLDGPVIRACLRLPAARRASTETEKPLLGTALAGLVPDQVFARRSKGDYTAEEYQGIRRAAPLLRRLLGDSRLAALGVVEPTEVRDSLERLVTGATGPLGELSQLLATELWLRDLEQTDTWSGLLW